MPWVAAYYVSTGNAETKIADRGVVCKCLSPNIEGKMSSTDNWKSIGELAKRIVEKQVRGK